MEQMRLSIHGSRTLKDERVRIIILEEIEKRKPTVVLTHGEPEGVCEMARNICREKAIPLKLFFLNFRYLRGAFEHRSKEVLRDSDHAVFIHDGKSKGTANEQVLAEKMGISHSVYLVEKTNYRSSVGFDVDAQWEPDPGDVPLIGIEEI